MLTNSLFVIGSAEELWPERREKFLTNQKKKFRCIFNLSLRTLFFYQTVCYHARDKQIGR